MVVSLADRITYWRERAKMSRSQLAVAAGVHKSVVTRWSNGEHLPTHASLARLAKALGITLEQFFSRRVGARR